jgi:hypothetical protein
MHSKGTKVAKGSEAYTKWHWGVEPSKEVAVKPPSVVINPSDKEKWKDMKLVECGRLVEIHYAPLDTSKRKDKILKLNKRNSNQSHLAFDLDHPNQRLYFILNPETMSRFKRDLKSDYPYMSLSELAEISGGRHASDDYEDIAVKPIGVLTNVVYACEKKGDGYSFYIHSMGEESGIQPVLAIAKDGSLWFAGGNYQAPVAGITD